MAPTPAPKPAKGKDGTESEEELGEKGKKALETERQARRDADAKVKDLEAQLAAAQDPAEKGEADKLNEQVAKLTEDLEKERLLRIRTEVASEKGLTPAQAKRLAGSTKEEMEADADDLLEAFPAPATGDEDGTGTGGASNTGTPAKPPTARPKPALQAGTGQDDGPVEETDIKKLGERMFSR